MPVLEGDAEGQVGERVVRGGLVGDDVDRRVLLEQRREHLGGVAQHPDGQGLPRVAGLHRELDGVLERVGLHVEVAVLDATGDPRLVDVDADRDAVVHRHGERLRPAHAAEAGGERDGAGERARRTSCRRPPRRSRRCPGGSPGCRCRSRTRRSSGRTWSGRAPRAGGTPPSWPSRRRGWSWRSAPAAPTRGSGRHRRACRSAPAWSRRRRVSVRVRTSASYDSQLRAAFPVPPYTTSSAGFSAFSGSRLFISIRSGASVCHDRAVSSVPWAA